MAETDTGNSSDSCRPCNIGIVGATGVVGRALFEAIANESDFNFEHIRLRVFASRDDGRTIKYNNKDISVEILNEHSFDDLDVALFFVPSKISLRWAPLAVQRRCLVIDNSSAFRMQSGIPLVVPEINADKISTNRGIISSPNCSTTLLALAIHDLHKVNPIEKLTVSTCQAVSGAGIKGIEDLEKQLNDYHENNSLSDTSYQALKRPVLLNVITHESAINESGNNGEEEKMMSELSKIMGEDIKMMVNCKRVGVYRAHEEDVFIRFQNPFSVEQIREIISSSEGLELIDDRETGNFPEPLKATNSNLVQVGRVREDTSEDDHRHFFLMVAGDQLLKGAALNTFQIFKCWYEQQH